MTLGPAGVLVTQFERFFLMPMKLRSRMIRYCLNPAPWDISGAGDAFLVVSIFH